jgi:hypothetical protein
MKWSLPSPPDSMSLLRPPIRLLLPASPETRVGEGGANQALDRIEDVVARLARGAAQGGQVHAAFSQEAKSNPAAASATLAGRSLASLASRRPR